jgi:nucleotidyltransferase/DNA polymerase involved in DNA repair
MPFSTREKSEMLKVKGVGKTVITRLEELGYHSLADLKSAQPQDITRRIAESLGSTCWQNSPQARQAIQGVVELAQDY